MPVFALWTGEWSDNAPGIIIITMITPDCHQYHHWHYHQHHPPHYDHM